jgi:tRNA(Ile)-lysidine synthase
VRKICADWEIELFVKRCYAKTWAEKNKITIQEAARELRYHFFNSLSKKHGFQKIAVAHHADDDLETFFINLFRGSGVNGLKGIPLKRGKIIRPLLPFKREELYQFALKNHLTWREDSSNQSDKYLRNRIRHHLIPLISQMIESDKGMFETLLFLKEDALLMEHWMQNEKKRSITTLPNGTLKIKTESFTDKEMKKKILYRLLKDYGFNVEQTINILQAQNNKAKGKIFFSNDYKLLVEDKQLIIKERTDRSTESYNILESTREIEQPFKAEIVLLKKDDIKPEQLKDQSRAFLDKNKLSFPLVIRKWKKGDRFIPFGMTKQKLLSDFFIDQKMNRFEKEELWIMESAGKIIWIVGHRISENVKVDSSTKEVLMISLKR